MISLLEIIILKTNIKFFGDVIVRDSIGNIKFGKIASYDVGSTSIKYIQRINDMLYYMIMFEDGNFDYVPAKKVKMVEKKLC